MYYTVQPSLLSLFLFFFKNGSTKITKREKEVYKAIHLLRSYAFGTIRRLAAAILEKYSFSLFQIPVILYLTLI